MGQVLLPYSLANGNLANASEVMANLNAIVNEINGNIESINIKDLNVTTSKLDDGAVTTDKIADANVTTDKIADANVTTDKIADSNVTTDKIADDAIDNSKIADDAVQAENIKGLTGTDAVNLDNIPDGSTYKKLADANSNNHPTKIDNNAEYESTITKRIYANNLVREYDIDNTWYAYLQYFAAPLTGSVTSRIHFNIPNGAIITYFAVYIRYNGGAPHTTNLYLRRTPIASTTYDDWENIAILSTSVKTGDSFALVSTTTITEPIVDLDNYYYFIKLREDNNLRDATVMIKPPIIEYQINKLAQNI